MAAPRFLGYVDKAHLAKMQNDTRVVENAVHVALTEQELSGGRITEEDVYEFMDGDAVLPEYEDRIFNGQNKATEEDLEEISEYIAEGGSFHKVKDEFLKDNTKSNLKGDFIANENGDVYYVSPKPIKTPGISGSNGSNPGGGDTPGGETNPDKVSNVKMTNAEASVLYEYSSARDYVNERIDELYLPNDPEDDWYEYELLKYNRGLALYNNLLSKIDSNDLMITGYKGPGPSGNRQDYTDYITMWENPVNLVFPSEIGGKKVVGVTGFFDVGVKEVTFPSGLILVGNRAFDRNHIEEVYLPDSVISLEGSAFESNRISKVRFSNNLIKIGSRAFQDNELINVSLPSKLKFIESDAFIMQGLGKTPQNMYSSSDWSPSWSGELNIPSSVEVVEWGAFARIPGSTTATVSSSTTYEDDSFGDFTINIR